VYMNKTIRFKRAMINCYVCREENDTFNWFLRETQLETTKTRLQRSIGSNGNSTGKYYNTGRTVIAHGKVKR
jgi:hypothetical protein